MNQQTNPISIVMADDHPLIREGFTVMVSKIEGVKLLATAANAEELVSTVQQHLPRIVVTDIKMPPGPSGIEATRRIKAMLPEVKVLGFSSYDETPLIKDMMQAGASGFLLKTASKEDWLNAFHAVLQDEDYYCADTVKKLAASVNEYLQQSEEEVDLTEREKQVLILIAKQRTLKQISEELYISIKTLEKHVSSLKQKIGVTNMAGIAVYAVKSGYV